MRGIPVQVADYPFSMLHFVKWKNRAKFAINSKTKGCMLKLYLKGKFYLFCTIIGHQKSAI
ncbi:hypothetical protein Z042_20815 [Chania multitudinisentens RB-25]|uniref:Uncharacterized protein n=1 Tax=Chania multitudinisentens RB-25 TaxID=1441930 RepID=W0LGH6_9GAMM|nr:hypothetical protein Z042_20815 [Chania multitudinisentens RB-25]